MAKKKYKIMFNNLEISSCNIDDFIDFENLLHIAAIHERRLGHLAECSKYEDLAADIIVKIGEQI